MKNRMVVEPKHFSIKHQKMKKCHCKEHIHNRRQVLFREKAPIVLISLDKQSVKLYPGCVFKEKQIHEPLNVKIPKKVYGAMKLALISRGIYPDEN